MMIFQCIAADECRCFFFSTDDGDNSIPSAIASLTVRSRDASHLASRSLLANVSRRSAQTTVQIRKEVRTKDERRTDSSSHPHGRVADFDLVTQQNMELRMTFQLSLKSTMNRGL